MLRTLAIAGRLHARCFASAASVHATDIVLRAVPPASRNLKALEVEFDNGERFTYSAEFLRVKSPAADNQRGSVRGKTRVMVVAGRRHVAIMSVEPIGNYAIRISFDDLHDTGIYTWNYLHSLGKNKFPLMREYIQLLRQQSLSREPSHNKTSIM